MHFVPGAADQELAAIGAYGIAGPVRDVAFVDVVEADFAGDGAGGVERFGRGSGLIHQFEIRMEGGEVQRNVWPQVFQNPIGNLAEFSWGVVEGGDDQVGDLEPHVGFFFQPEQGFQDRL